MTLLAAVFILQSSKESYWRARLKYTASQPIAMKSIETLHLFEL